MAFELPPLPNFNVNVPAMPSPLDQYGKMLQLKSLLGQQSMLPYQQQEAQQRVQAETLENQQRQLEMQSQQAMMKAWSDPDFTKSITSGDAATSSGVGFDPNALTQGLIKKGVLPKDAMAMTQSFVERSQKIAETLKAQAQTGEANAGIREKTLKQVGDALGAIQSKPVYQAQEALQAFKQKLVQDPKAFPGLTQDEMAHLYAMDLGHLGSAGGLLQLEATMTDFHKSQAEKTSAEQKVINPATGMSPEEQSIIKKDVITARAEQPLKIEQAKAEAIARQQAAQGDPNVAGQLLANGSLTLADLKTRGSTPQFIEQATLAAQKQNPQYNPADEVIAEQVAKSQSANQFFGSANSLISKGGTLDQLTELSKKIPQHDFPVLNKVDDWQKLARGKGPLAGYAAMALGVADDYGKVMGGGTASDTARDAALSLFGKASSPEMRADAIKATRGAVLSQRDSRIGNNQFLRRQYGAEVGGMVKMKAPNGAIKDVDQSDVDYYKSKGATVVR